MKLVAIVLMTTFLGIASTLAEDFDIYVNDDGVTCSVMVDFDVIRDRLGKADEIRELPLRKHLAEAVKSIPKGQCSPESGMELFAIMVLQNDSYGQPHWGSVEYLAEYRGDLAKLQELRPADMTDEVLESLLEKID
jgi:hypothetical protein